MTATPKQENGKRLETFRDNGPIEERFITSDAPDGSCVNFGDLGTVCVCGSKGNFDGSVPPPPPPRCENPDWVEKHYFFCNTKTQQCTPQQEKLDSIYRQMCTDTNLVNADFLRGKLATRMGQWAKFNYTLQDLIQIPPCYPSNAVIQPILTATGQKDLCWQIPSAIQQTCEQNATRFFFTPTLFPCQTQFTVPTGFRTFDTVLGWIDPTTGIIPNDPSIVTACQNQLNSIFTTPQVSGNTLCCIGAAPCPPNITTGPNLPQQTFLGGTATPTQQQIGQCQAKLSQSTYQCNPNTKTCEPAGTSGCFADRESCEQAVFECNANRNVANACFKSPSFDISGILLAVFGVLVVVFLVWLFIR